MYVHVRGHGNAVDLARVVAKAIALTKTPPTSPPAAARARVDFDVDAVERAIGSKGRVAGGGLQVRVPPREAVTEEGAALPAGMGAAGSIVNFQPTGAGRAIVVADFALLGTEVTAVARGLTARGFEITALHNHMLSETPRMFYLHVMAQGDAVALAAAIRTAIARR